MKLNSKLKSRQSSMVIVSRLSVTVEYVYSRFKYVFKSFFLVTGLVILCSLCASEEGFGICDDI